MLPLIELTEERGDGVGGWGGAKLYDGEKAWSFQYSLAMGIYFYKTLIIHYPHTWIPTREANQQVLTNLVIFVFRDSEVKYISRTKTKIFYLLDRSAYMNTNPNTILYNTLYTVQ